MRLPFITIDGKQYRWKEILAFRSTQLAEARTASTAQLALFESLYDDHRPIDARTASGRYQQPSLFEIGA